MDVKCRPDENILFLCPVHLVRLFVSNQTKHPPWDFSFMINDAALTEANQCNDQTDRDFSP